MRHVYSAISKIFDKLLLEETITVIVLNRTEYCTIQVKAE